MQPFLTQTRETRERVAGQQQLQHLVEETRGRHVVHQISEFLDRRARRFIDLEAELGREAHDAQHAHRVFAITRGRIADHAQKARANVGHAVVIIQHRLRCRIVVHRVDGEVAARRVFVLLAPHVVAQHAAARVHRVRAHVELAAPVASRRFGDRLGRRVDERAERGRFDDLLPELDVDDLKPPPDDARPAKEPLHLIGRGVGGDVEIFRRDAGAADRAPPRRR